MWAVTATPTIGSSLKTYRKLLLAFFLLILIVPPVVGDEPPKDGPHVEYYENGKKEAEGHWEDGKKEGLWTGCRPAGDDCLLPTELPLAE